MFLTYSDYNIKNKTIGQAIKQAQLRLKEKDINRVSGNAFAGKDPETLITLLDMNKLVEKIIADTLYYE